MESILNDYMMEIKKQKEIITELNKIIQDNIKEKEIKNEFKYKIMPQLKKINDDIRDIYNTNKIEL